ncbi:MAG: hypothetical protein DHS20C01_25470 [marine bacterium B5-7]|nr:MAG: hypothetical protein DHS20C01_25470 [marine bacterium B5-7]
MVLVVRGGVTVSVVLPGTSGTSGVSGTLGDGLAGVLGGSVGFRGGGSSPDGPGVRKVLAPDPGGT